MTNPSNPRQAALAFLDGENFSPDSYFEAWNLDNSISGISATTIDENGNSREFQRSNLDCFDKNSAPIDSDTLFNIASMTKMMTAATILRMIESEEIEIKEFIAGEEMIESEEFTTYFPDKLKTKLSHFYDFIEARYPEMAYVTSGRLRGENEEITLEHLLTHTSGIPDMNPAEARKLPLEGMADGKFLDPVTIRNEPGEFEYSDIGFELLGLVISSVATHQAAKVVSCQEMIRKMVIEKLEMQNTYTSDQMSLEGDRVIVSGHPEKKIARGFILNDDNIIENRNFTRCISCAAVYSTPKEMCKFVTALFSDKTFANGGLFETSDSIDLHNSARVTQIENGAPKSDDLGDWYFGIGFRFIEKDNKKIKFHTGASPGFPGWSGCKDGKAVCVLMNSQSLTPIFAKEIFEMEKEKMKAEGKSPLSNEEEHLRFCKINERLVRGYDKETLLGVLNEIKLADGDKKALLREHCRNLYPDSSIFDQEAESFTGALLQRERK